MDAKQGNYLIFDEVVTFTENFLSYYYFHQLLVEMKLLYFAIELTFFMALHITTQMPSWNNLQLNTMIK